MKIEKAKQVQERIAKEAVALMVLQSEEGNGKADSWVEHYEEAVSLVGRAWRLPPEDTMTSLDLIRQEQEVLEKRAAGEEIPHILPESELPMNATGSETLDNVWALFETAIRVKSPGERELLFNLAGELAECQNLADWLKETPGEAQQQHGCPEMEMAM